MATPVQLKALLDLSDGVTFNETSADCYDVSDIVITANTRRGRSRELDKIESGYAVITVIDENGDFNPDNTASPYYGKLRPGNKLRLYPMYNDGTGDFRYPDIFTGYITNYGIRFSMGVDVANQIVIEAYDAFKIFNSLSITEVTNSTTGDSSDERINDILDEISWPSSTRLFETSALSLADDQGDLRTVLDAIRQVEDTEAGLIFIDGSGNVVFKNRTTANTQPNYNDAYKFSDDGIETSYNDLRLTQNDDILINRVTVKSYNGSNEATVFDGTSETTYFTRSAERTNVLLTSTTDLTDLANQLLANRKDTSLQIDRIILNLAEYQEIDRVIAGLYFDIFFIPLYITKTLSGNSTINRLGWIQGVNHDITKNTWLVTAFTGLTSPFEPIENWGVSIYRTPLDFYYEFQGAIWFQTESYRYGYNVTIDSADNIITVGDFTNNTTSGISVIKLENTGTILNKKVLPIPGILRDGIYSNIAIDNNDGLYIRYSTSGTYSYIAHLDSNLNVDWSKKYAKTDRFDGLISVDSNNNVYICGDDGELNFTSQVFVTKIDNTGNEVWQKTYYLTTNDLEVFGFSINNNNKLAFGAISIESGQANDRNAIVRLNNSGEITSQIFYYGTSSGFNFRTLKLDDNDNIYIAGSALPGPGISFQVVKFNASNEVVWAKLYDSAYNTSTNQLELIPHPMHFDASNNLVVQVTAYPYSNSFNSLSIITIDADDGSIIDGIALKASLDNFGSSNMAIDSNGRMVMPTTYWFGSDYSSQTIFSLKPEKETFGTYTFHTNTTFTYTGYDFVVLSTTNTTVETSNVTSKITSYTMTNETLTIIDQTSEVVTIEFD